MLSLKDKSGLVWFHRGSGLNRFDFGFETLKPTAAIHSKYLCLIYGHNDCLKFCL